jgi:flavodoxin I
MKAMILFESLFGNTEKIAQSLAKGIRNAGIEATVVDIKAAKLAELEGYDLLAFGAPTQIMTASKTFKAFLEQLKSIDLKGSRGFAFDTKLESRFSGSAAKFIEKKLVELGLEIIRPRASAIVFVRKKTDRNEETVLKDGMENTFELIGREIGALLKTPKVEAR